METLPLRDRGKSGPERNTAKYFLTERKIDASSSLEINTRWGEAKSPRRGKKKRSQGRWDTKEGQRGGCFNGGA